MGFVCLAFAKNPIIDPSLLHGTFESRRAYAAVSAQPDGHRSKPRESINNTQRSFLESE
jgi:hypothetical protein